jgi:hypothetical protein
VRMLASSSAAGVGSVSAARASAIASGDGVGTLSRLNCPGFDGGSDLTREGRMGYATSV